MSANETLKSENSDQEEQNPLNVLIIACMQNQLASAASFLNRRGIPCTVKGNIKEGIQFITSQKATMVFLSWNLPNANIIKTFQLLTKTFNVDCIVFAEKPDGKTAVELNSSRLPEVMQAPVSGPGFYMRIQKILKSKEEEKHNKDYDQKSLEYRQYNQQDQKIVLKSDGNVSNSDHYINFGSQNQSKTPAMINFQSPKYSNEDYEISDPSANDISAYLESLDLELPDTFTKEGLKSSNHQVETSSTADQEKKTSLKRDLTSYGSVVNIAKKRQAKKTEIIEQPSKAKETPIADFKPQSGSKNANSILAQKTFEAIERSVRPAIENYDSVKAISKAKIFNIHTPSFKGYLIFVVPMFNELERSIVTKIKTNLEDLLSEQNEYMVFFEELNIEIEQTDFLKWAQENADFFIQTVDHKTEIICAFYPYNPSLPRIDDHTHNKMTTIEIKDLKLNTKTNVNLYIHLPKNNKFICYMKPGEVITQRHKDKFEKHKMDNLHIKNNEVRAFKEYFVSNQVKGIIKPSKN